jgi:S-formylglutathione hydrolase FrmB
MIWTSTRRARLRTRLAVAAAATLYVATAATAHADGLSVVSVQPVSARLTEYTLSSTAMAGQTKVRLLLPAGYDANANRRYPVLLLLHGCCDDFRSWTDDMGAEALTAPYPVIVVMPDGGAFGWYSDWYNGGAGGAPRYETYNIDELLPWVDSTFRTIPSRSGRAVAGLSMGGFGALSLAARHPNTFTAAASYSGVVDAIAMSTSGIVPPSFFPPAVWGPLATDRARWEAHNPQELADKLRGLSLLELRTGNGQPGPLDSGTRIDPIETEIGKENQALHARLDELGIPHTWDYYGPGTHTAPYWARDLQRTLPNLMAVFPTVLDGGVGGTVPATLGLSLESPAPFGAFAPGVAATYRTTATATSISTAADATLSVSDPSSTSPGHLVNGTFSLPQPLRVSAASALGTAAAQATVSGAATPLLTYGSPVSNDAATLTFEQTIGATDALRTGAYSKTLLFTLSTTTP